MQKSIPIGIAMMAAACGSAVTITSSAVAAATQKQRRSAPSRPHVEVPNFDDNAGMAGCFDPNLTGYPRRAAIAAGGHPCATSRSWRVVAAVPLNRTWPAGRWTLRGQSCGAATWNLMSNGVYDGPGERGLWTLNGSSLFLNPNLAEGRPYGGGQIRQMIVARAPNSFSMRAANGAVSHWVRCS